MKKVCFIFLFLISFLGSAQNNYIVKTDDGRRVLLKADYTWEYIDAVPQKGDSIKIEAPKIVENKECSIPDNFTEPKLDKNIQDKLKRGQATIEHVKKKVAKDNGCTVEDVVLISVSENLSNGFYDFCVKGKKANYKRVGNSIIKRKSLFN